MNTLPQNLEGINCLWDLILLAEDDSVIDSISDLINKLYIHLTPDLEKEIVNIRNENLARTMHYFHIVHKQKADIKESLFVKYSARVLLLIRSVLDQSEKKGIGNLKSHSALVKGELMNFNIINDFSSSSDIPKKIEIRVYSNATIFELRIEIAKQIKETWDQVSSF